MLYTIFNYLPKKINGFHTHEVIYRTTDKESFEEELKKYQILDTIESYMCKDVIVKKN